MESLSHSEDRAIPLAQAAKIVKPGGIVAGWQWMLKPAFDYENERHLDLKRGMEYGGGLRNLNKPSMRHEEYARAGLEVLESYDMGTDAIERGHMGWWKSLTTGVDLPSRASFGANAIPRRRRGPLRGGGASPPRPRRDGSSETPLLASAPTGTRRRRRPPRRRRVAPRAAPSARTPGPGAAGTGRPGVPP